MLNDTIREFAYNAAFGGIHCEEFYVFTIPAIVTMIITAIIFIKSIKHCNRIYKIGDAVSLVFSIGFLLFFIDLIISYSLDPQEEGIIMNIIAFVLLGFFMAISYLLLVIIPFTIMALLLFFSHAIAVDRKYKKNETAVDNVLMNNKMADEEKVSRIVEIMGFQNGLSVALFVKQLLKAISWSMQSYKGVSYYNIFVHSIFREHGKLFIVLHFDDDYLSLVQAGCKNYDYYGFECVRDSVGWKLQYTAWFKNDEERNVALDDIKTIATLLDIEDKVIFPD